jgi:hypothetical protein
MSRIIVWGGMAAMLMAVSLVGANFAVSTTRLSFGSVKTGANKTMTFKINPPSAMDFEISSSDGAFSIVGDKSFRAGRETTITVRFAPADAGPKEGTITINAPNDGITKTVAVSGTAE